MRLAWMTGDLWPQAVGGAQWLLESLSRCMSHAGHEVQLWSTGLPPGRRDRTPDGREIVGFRCRTAPSCLWRLRPALQVADMMASLSVLPPADVVYTVSPLMAAAWLLSGRPAPLVFTPGATVIGSLAMDFGELKEVRTKWRPWDSCTPGRQYLLAERIALSRSAAIVAVSDVARKQMLRACPGCGRRAVVIHTGYDASRGFGSLADAAPPPADRPFTAVCVARLVRIKNIPHLLHAWAQVRHQPKRLLLVGDGSEEQSLRALAEELGIADSVEFLGRRMDVPQLLADSDVFVLPSRFDAFPNTVLEAMSMGLPCLTVRSVAGVSEVGADEANLDGVTGWCVDPLDAGDLARRLDQLAEDPALARRMGDAGRQRVERQFRVERAADDYLAVARELLQGGRP